MLTKNDLAAHNMMVKRNLVCFPGAGLQRSDILIAFVRYDTDEFSKSANQKALTTPRWWQCYGRHSDNRLNQFSNIRTMTKRILRILFYTLTSLLFLTAVYFILAILNIDVHLDKFLEFGTFIYLVIYSIYEVDFRISPLISNRTIIPKMFFGGIVLTFLTIFTDWNGDLTLGIVLITTIIRDILPFLLKREIISNSAE